MRRPNVPLKPHRRANSKSPTSSISATRHGCESDWETADDMRAGHGLLVLPTRDRRRAKSPTGHKAKQHPRSAGTLRPRLGLPGDAHSAGLQEPRAAFIPGRARSDAAMTSDHPIIRWRCAGRIVARPEAQASTKKGQDMRALLFTLASISLIGPAVADDYYTSPYVRKDGTPVQGHYSTQPNEYRYDNYSSRGNTNPYTGERGSQRNEFTTPPAYNTGRSHSDSYGGSAPRSNPYSGSRSRSRF